MTIRRASVEDIPQIYRLIQSATRRGKVLRRSVDELRKAVRRFRVIEKENRIVACCALEIYNKKLAEIRSLVVESGESNKGLATQLLDWCLQEAKKKKIYEVLAITDRGNLFKRLGFMEQLHGQKALFVRP
ncbi:MAG: GNAT family N-acetyltransferase [Elusimicrobia bacterium]|nr:GNAT family N-acetyltransferase [Elusimicrobiota bacterium]